MKALAVFFDYNSPSYFIPILLAIKKINPAIDCYLVGDISKRNEYNSQYELLKKNGVIFFKDNEFLHQDNFIYFLDYNYVSALNNRIGKHVVTITYYHASDCNTVPQNTCHIFTVYRQIMKVCEQLGVKPSLNALKLPQVNSEVFLGGFYHYFEVFPFLKNDKITNQKKLAEKLNLPLQYDKPLISYTFGEFNREYKFINVFKKLSEQYNFIVKVLYPDQAEKLRKENLMVCDRWREPLLRIASDINLVSLGSGSLLSSFALGLKSIPVYSENMGLWYPLLKNDLMIKKGLINKSFSFFINKKPIYAKPFSNEFISYRDEYYDIVPPVCLYDFEQLKSVIENKGFWKSFDRKINAERKKVFGDIVLEDSVKRTAEYVLSILLK